MSTKHDRYNTEKTVTPSIFRIVKLTLNVICQYNTV